MAQNYIYSQEYVNEINEQAYNAVTSNDGMNSNKTEKEIGIETRPGNVLSEFDTSTEHNSELVSNEMKEKLYNSFTGLGLVILILYIIYLFNKTLFWFIVAGFCISCYYLVSIRFGFAEGRNDLQVNQNV